MPVDSQVVRAHRRLLEWAFAALSVIVVWNLELSRRLRDIAISAGIEDTSFAMVVLVDTAVPIALVGLTALAVFFYDRFLWRISARGDYLGGLWLYSLIARTENGDTHIAGRFVVKHLHSRVEVVDGVAYYREPDCLIFRGQWTATMVWTSTSTLSFVFEMRAPGASRELPSTYDGIMRLNFGPEGHHRTGQVCSGYFHDLGDRRGVHGPVAALRAKGCDAQNADDMLAKSVVDLEERALSLIGRASIPLPTQAAGGRPRGATSESGE